MINSYLLCTYITPFIIPYIYIYIIYILCIINIVPTTPPSHPLPCRQKTGISSKRGGRLQPPYAGTPRPGPGR